jgi:hypothetical protein
MPDDTINKRQTEHLSISFNPPEDDGQGSPPDSGEAAVPDLALTCTSSQPLDLGAAADLVLTGAPPGRSVALTATVGTAAMVGAGSTQVQTDTLTFAAESEQSLSRVPAGAVTLTWIGRDPGVNVVVDGDTIRLSEPATGVLRAAYSYRYDKIRLSGVSSAPAGVGDDDSFDVLVVATCQGGSANASVTYSTDTDGGAGTGSATVDVDLMVRDFCTGDPVSGATVSAGGQIKTTNAAGVARLLSLTPGQTYDITITASGYVDSDQDLLSNDSFTVPES